MNSKTLLFLLFIIFPGCVYANQISFFKGSVDKTTLICSIETFNFVNQPEKYKIKWIPKNKEFTHILFKQSANLKDISSEFLKKQSFAGKIKVYNKKNIIWTYTKVLKFKNQVGRTKNEKVTIKNIYRFASKKYFMDITWRNNYSLASANGSCEMKQVDTEAIKIAQEKEKRNAELKLQKLTEEKEEKIRAQEIKRETELAAQRLLEEKAENLKTKEKENRLKAEIEKIKKKAAEVARKKRLKEENQKKKKLVQEKAKLKAQKLAKEKAEIKNDTLEYVNMIQDIEVFSSKQNIFDPIKIGTLFVKLDNSKKNKWTINSSKVYRELKKYVFSFNDFKDFREQRKQNRLNIENESLDILSKNLNSKISLLKEYISKNLRSKNIPIVIELISKIEKELANKNVKSLKILNQKVQEWISKNIKNSKTKNKTKTIKTEDRQTIPLSKDNSIRFDLLSSAIISKEFGDGFSNYEANKNNYLCGLILKINNVSKKSYNTKDLNFRVTFDSNRVVQEAKDVSQAFTLQEGLDNVGGTTLKPGANYSTGIGFILPSTELDTKYILLEVLKNKKIIFQQKILSTKN